MHGLTRAPALRAVAAVSVAALVLGACGQGGGRESRRAPEDRAAATAAGTSSTRPQPGSVAGSGGRSAVRSFSFAAAGDLGANRHTAEGLRRLDRSNAEFFLALGDLDYDQTPTDRAWCRYVKRRLDRKGIRFPFQLEVGNHEADGGEDGRIRHHRRCLPDRLDSRGKYARQYSFTFPRRNPFAMFIQVAPALTVDGHTYRYGRGQADRRWLKAQIDRARSTGIDWVVVGMHKPCLSMGAGHPGCASGAAVLNYLLRREVDLVLTGHNHVYERSKQIALSSACQRIRPQEYDDRCVSDSGEDGVYPRGSGTVQVTSGRFGGRHQGIDRGDPQAPYFVKAGGRTTGFVRYTLTPDRLEGRYVNTSGGMRDSFVIE